MKSDLDATIENLPDDLELSGDSNIFAESPAQKPEVPTQAELNACKTKPVLLCLVPPYAASYVLPSRKIPTIMGFFDKNYLELPFNELIKMFQNTVTKEQIDQVQKDTTVQSSGTNVFRHRAGRISASQSKAVAHSDPGMPPQSQVQRMC